MSTKNWETEFDDDLFDTYDDTETPPALAREYKWPESKWELDPDKVVAFIRTLLSEQREEMREKIEALKWPEPPTYPNDPVGDETWKRWSSREMDINAALKALQDPTT